jgi:hypothetical protein
MRKSFCSRHKKGKKKRISLFVERAQLEVHISDQQGTLKDPK